MATTAFGAMADAEAQGLDLDTVATALSQSPGASSGEFISHRYGQGARPIAAAAHAVGAWVPVPSPARQLFEDLGPSDADAGVRHPASQFEFVRKSSNER